LIEFISEVIWFWAFFFTESFAYQLNVLLQAYADFVSPLVLAACVFLEIFHFICVCQFVGLKLFVVSSYNPVFETLL
jgi:hypothetical protein